MRDTNPATGKGWTPEEEELIAKAAARKRQSCRGRPARDDSAAAVDLAYRRNASANVASWPLHARRESSPASFPERYALRFAKRIFFRDTQRERNLAKELSNRSAPTTRKPEESLTTSPQACALAGRGLPPYGVLKLMYRVLQLDLPTDHKLTLEIMAVHANPDGSSCCPSVATLMSGTRLSDRGVQKVLRILEEASYIRQIGKAKGGRGKSAEYRITLEAGDKTMLDKYLAEAAETRRRNRNPEPGSPFVKDKTPNQEAENLVKTPNRDVTNPEPGSPDLRSITKSKNKRPLGGATAPSGGTSQPAQAAASPLVPHRTLLPQQKRWIDIRFLQNYAVALLRNKLAMDDVDLSLELKEYAAHNDKRYFDAWPGANPPIQQAIINARAVLRDEATAAAGSIAGDGKFPPTRSTNAKVVPPKKAKAAG